MLFNRHSKLPAEHAFLSPSYYHWLNYDDQKLEARYFAVSNAARGTQLHKLAHDAIRLNVRLAKSNRALARYVSDGIGYKMSCEQPLVYSDNCFGTADTICFRRNTLRVHDLKTGVERTSEKQLQVYAALFCLEYEQDPFDIQIELRIYQREEVRPFFPTPEEIAFIMQKIVDFDQQIEEMKEDRW